MNTTNGIKLPQLHDSVLDDTTLEALLVDLETLTEILEIRVRSTARALSTAASPTVEDLRTALRNKEIDGARIRYRHDGQVWSDTLVVGPDGVRLVRMGEP